MPLPPEQFEALLNEYLDDALSGPRLAAVERALQEDVAVARRLESLRAERTERLLAMRDDPRFADVRLDSQFSQRVWQAIAAELPRDAAAMDNAFAVDSVRRLSAGGAETERFAGTHPTSRMARWRRPATALVTMAAALLFAVTLFRGGEPQPDPSTLVDNGAVAADDSPAQASVVAVPESLEILDPEDLVDAALDTEAAPATEEIAQTEPAASSSDVASSMTTDVPDPNAIPEPSSPAMDTSEPRGSAPSTPEVVVAEAAAALDSDKLLDPDNTQMALSVVLVSEVIRTEQGKASDAVMQALRSAGIDVHAQRAIDPQVVGYLQAARLVDANENHEQRASILYIEASGKALDRFMVTMFGDMENIQEIRWSMATDTPLVAAVKHLHQVSATDVQHAEDSSTAWQLVSGEGEQSDFAVSSQPRELPPLKRERWVSMNSMSPGPDIQSRLILLVR